MTTALTCLEQRYFSEDLFLFAPQPFTGSTFLRRFFAIASIKLLGLFCPAFGYLFGKGRPTKSGLELSGDFREILGSGAPRLFGIQHAAVGAA